MTDPAHKEINPLVNTEDQSGAGQPLRYANDPDPAQSAQLPTIELPEVEPAGDFESRCEQTLLLAEEAFAQTGSWVVFFREVLGVQGIVARLFPSKEERRRFITRSEYATLQEMLAAIRSQDQSKSDAAEPERMITIRIPRSLHEAMQEESEDCGLSINKLAISKLLQPANPRFVPEQRGRRRGRRPGPQGSRTKASRNVGANEAAEPQHNNRVASGGDAPERGMMHRWTEPAGNQGKDRR